MTLTLEKKNWYAAAAHLGSFLLIIILFNVYSNSQKHAVAQTFRYTIPKPDDPVGGPQCNTNGEAFPSDFSGQCNTDPILAVPKKSFKFNVIFGVLMFFAITAFAHIFYATDGFNTGKYSEVISQGWNPYRWVEYAASASIMTVIIAYQLGIRDFNHLTSLVFMNVAVQTCGFLVENALIQPKVNFTTVKGATFIGWLLLLGIWIPILYAFYSIVEDVKYNFEGKVEPPGSPDAGNKIRIPSFVWFIVIVQVINFSSFGFIQLSQVRNALSGIRKPYSSYESGYLTLSFAGKIALAGALAYGLIFRTKDCE